MLFAKEDCHNFSENMPQVTFLMAVSPTLFFRNMPWQAPFKILTGEEREPRGELSEGGSGGVVKKVFLQSMAKVCGKVPEKKNPKKAGARKVPKEKPKIVGPIFSRSPIKMKKVGLRGKQKKPTSYMSAGEDDLEIDADEQRCARDGLVGACEKLGRGGGEESFMRLC